MKAAWYDRYGAPGMVGLRDIDRPDPAAGEILVKVAATSVTTADWRFRASAFPRAFWLAGRLMAGLFRPRHNVLGGEFAGEVAAVGEGVTEFAPGDRVFGFSGWGAHAEYLTIRAGGAVWRMPGGLSYEQAAAVPFGGLAALVFLRDFAKVQPGERVLVLGASGGVGVWAVQIARRLGAGVTAVASAGKLDLMRELGADHAIDRHREDYRAGAERYDVIIDTVGASSFAEVRHLMPEGGRYVPLEFGPREIWQSMTARGPKVVIGISGDRQDDLAQLAEWLERGDIRPVIDAVYPLERIAEAHARVESRRKTGSVVVSVGAAAAQSALSRSAIRSSASSSPMDSRKMPSPA